MWREHSDWGRKHQICIQFSATEKAWVTLKHQICQVLVVLKKIWYRSDFPSVWMQQWTKIMSRTNLEWCFLFVSSLLFSCSLPGPVLLSWNFISILICSRLHTTRTHHVLLRSLVFSLRYACHTHVLYCK